MSLYDELNEQGSMLRKALDYYRGREGDKLLAEAAKVIKCGKRKNIVFLGMGTSGMAPYIIRDLLANKAGIISSLWDAGEFYHYARTSVRKDDVVIAVSQSGESFETKNSFVPLKNRRNKIAITNNPESAIARAAGINLPMLAGEESSISNKTYTNTLAVLLLLCHKVTGESNAKTIKLLYECAEQIDDFIAKRTGEIAKAAGFLGEPDNLNFIGRGPGFVSAVWSALTWAEGAKMNATPFTGGLFRHGPFEMVGKKHRAVFYIPDGKGGDILERTAKEISGLGSKVLAITCRRIKSGKNIFVIKLKPSDERTFPVASAIVHELLFAKMAEKQGYVPGKFLRIGKITKVE